MAKPSWLYTTPSSGSGNGTISNSANAHTGRLARTGTVTVTGVGVESPATYQVTQSPKAEFVEFDEGTGMSAPKDGGIVTVTGTSNSSKLYYYWRNLIEPQVDLPSTYTANGSSATNNQEISGDPGATSEFAFSIRLSFPANDKTYEVDRILIIQAEGGQSKQLTISQAAGEATLTVTPTEITIPQDGTAQTVQVTSNTTWTVS